jgi:excisionase family DNA binding protein
MTILTPAMAARLLHVNERTVRNMLNDRTLRGTKINGKLWRIPAEAIQELMSCQNTDSQGTAKNLSLSSPTKPESESASEPARLTRALRSVS